MEQGAKGRRIHRLMHGLGENTARNPSKALLIPGDIIGAVVSRAVLLENKSRGIGQTPPHSSSPMLMSTTTPCPPPATTTTLPTLQPPPPLTLPVQPPHPPPQPLPQLMLLMIQLTMGSRRQSYHHFLFKKLSPFEIQTTLSSSETHPY